jgi:hypothetical protein
MSSDELPPLEGHTDSEQDSDDEYGAAVGGGEQQHVPSLLCTCCVSGYACYMCRWLCMLCVPSFDLDGTSDYSPCCCCLQDMQPAATMVTAAPAAAACTLACPIPASSHLISTLAAPLVTQAPGTVTIAAA